MIAVDTNILVRLLTNDDPGQARRAAGVMASGEVLIPKTVLLETEWVLRHAYGIDREAIRDGFKKLMGLVNVSVEGAPCVYQAVSWYEAGLDFADALHLASGTKADTFVTFDKALVKKARQISPVSVSLP